MTPRALAITAGRVVDPGQGIDRVADVLIRDGRIEALTDAPGQTSLDGYDLLDAKGLVVAPGFIDLHTHLREPGEEHKETIATGTAAAARGGFTTVCAMPNTKPAQDNEATVDFVLRTARAHGAVRVLPIGAVTIGRAGKQLVEMAELAEAGVIGFSDDGNPVADPNLMRQALSYSTIVGLPIINHCEEPSLVAGGQMNEGVVASRLGLMGAPGAAEAVMVERDIALAELTGGRVHIAHLSTRRAVEHVRAAKQRGVAVTAEATPHHLTLTDTWVYGLKGEVPGDGLRPGAYDTHTKVNPPLRAQDDVDAVVEALAEGVIDAIATDHAPHAETDKVCTYAEAAHGISVLETAFGSCMSLVHSGAMDLSTLIQRLTAAPARFLGMELGSLRGGWPADVVLLDPDTEWAVDPAAFVSKGKNSPLGGVTLKGRVAATVYGGEVVYRGDAGDG